MQTDTTEIIYHARQKSLPSLDIASWFKCSVVT